MAENQPPELGLLPAPVDYLMFGIFSGGFGAFAGILVNQPNQAHISSAKDKIASEQNVLTGMQDAANRVSPNAPSQQQLQATITEQKDLIHRMQSDIPASRAGIDIVGGAILGALGAAILVHRSRRNIIRKQQAARHIPIELTDVRVSSVDEAQATPDN